VSTPNGIGYAFGQLPDGKVLVSHNWKDLSETFQANFIQENGYKDRVVIQKYPKESLDDITD
jgi:hypothetical protein